MLDLKITGGTIVDGTGSPGFTGDVGIRDGRIVAVGEVSEDARETVDATGRIVSPGFIDVHTHYDVQVFWDPALSPSCFHGVTTVLGGFCGFSVAPLTEQSAKYLAPMLARVEGMPLETLELAVPWDWRSFGDYLDRLEGGIGLNAGFFAGHSAIRRIVMGERSVGEEASDQDLAAMKALLAKSEVEHVVVVELDKTLIDMVEPHYACERLSIIQGNIFDGPERLGIPKTAYHHWAWFDIWDTIDMESLEDFATLRDTWGGWCGSMEFWVEKECIAQARMLGGLAPHQNR